MAMSNYPNGFPTGVMIRNVPLAQTHPGNVYWLYNGTNLLPGQRGGSDANRGTFNSPFSTLAGALAQCVAGRGDVIFVKPGHAETVSSSTALTMSIAGVAVVGLGTGTSRPKWTIDTANTATINVSAADVSFQNVQIVGNFLSIAAAFTLSTAKNFTLQDVEIRDTSSVLNFLNAVKTTGAANTADGLTIINSYWKGLGTTSVNAFVLTANTIDSLVFKGNTAKLARTADAAQIVVTSGILTNLDCGDNKVYTAQTATSAGSLINVGGTTSNGHVYRNYVQTLTTASDLLFTTTVGLSAFDNRVTGVVGASGFLIPAADS
ncbi:hypothetical protein [Bradyrhizobium tunisiense]|uniref:hypothetical protein n=1 Tax=Bradyrhizobium tunisiense TaxID=3278709 RepID=UPI0035DCBE3B